MPFKCSSGVLSMVAERLCQINYFVKLKTWFILVLRLDLLILDLGIPGNLVRGLVDAQGAWYGPGMLKGLPG